MAKPDEDEQYIRLKCLTLAGRHERASAGFAPTLNVAIPPATEAVMKRAKAYLAFVLGEEAQDDDGDPGDKG
jgi:ABC-type glycerol-3-phosphate transport system substrate-binding protein